MIYVCRTKIILPSCPPTPPVNNHENIAMPGGLVGLLWLVFCFTSSTTGCDDAPACRVCVDALPRFLHPIRGGVEWVDRELEEGGAKELQLLALVCFLLGKLRGSSAHTLLRAPKCRITSSPIERIRSPDPPHSSHRRRFDLWHMTGL